MQVAVQDCPAKVEIPALDLVPRKVLDLLEHNLAVLDTVEVGVKILGDKKGGLFADTNINRWYYENITLCVSDIEWTFEHVFYLFRAASGISHDKVDDKNVRLLRLAGSTQRVVDYYFQKLHCLSKTYEKLGTDGKKASEEIEKIILIYHEKIQRESKENYLTYSRNIGILLEVPEIPTDGSHDD